MSAGSKENEEAINEIRAMEIAIEVTDLKTGRTFRRTLPVDYHETANLLRLAGEDRHGRPSEIVFFTSEGHQHMLDMTGAGADHDSCGTH